MRRVYTVLFLLALIVSAGYSQKASWQDLPDGFMDVAPEKRNYDVLKISNFDYLSDDFDAFWAKVPNLDTLVNSIEGDNVRPAESEDDHFVLMKSAWDDDYLYIGFKVTDDYIADPTDSIQDQFEIFWATYPDYWRAIMDTATSHFGYVCAHARWDTTGSRKTGNWQLIDGGAAVWDDYRVSWSWDPWGPSATPWAVGWGSPADEYLMDAVYNKVDATHYTYLAVIPWFDAMEGFIPVADTSLSMELKSNDKDPDKLPHQASWSMGHNDAYWNTYYSSVFTLIEDLTAPVLSDVTASVDTKTDTDISATSDEDAMLYLVPTGTAADVDAIVAAAVVDTSSVAGTPVVMDISEVTLGNYDLYAIDISDNISAAAAVEIMSTVGIAENRARVFGVYPNPVADVLYFMNPQNIQKVEIANILGQNVKVFDVVYDSHDVSDLANGIYFVRLHVEGEVIVKSLVKK